MDRWICLTPDNGSNSELKVYKEDYLGHHIADGWRDEDTGEYDRAGCAGSQTVILSPAEMASLPPIKAFVEGLTGHEDRSLWWLSFVDALVCQYEREHNWEADEDPSATIDALSTVRGGLIRLREALANLEAKDED